ncbi:hypothetical protein AB0G15_38640 [Streptosporangium sp. NPDC023825]|uniref:hypothetical protein n=1 Tax=Streptosporangium sp. NPDC023825 TaxID=3154909 RepID=UPI00341321B5
MRLPDARSDMSQAGRVGRYGEVASALALRSDRQLAASLEHAQVMGSGIGGSSVLLDVAGVPVFAKRVLLTDVERHAGNVMSTANLFGVPAFCQYGLVEVGGPARRNDYIRACAAGAEPAGAPPAAAAVIRRYAPVAAAMNDFYWDLFGVDRATPYPGEKVERALSALR